MNKHNFSSGSWLTLIAVVLLSACNSSDDNTVTEESAAQTEPKTASKAQASAKSQPAAPASWCSFISPEDVAAALGGNLPLGAPKSLRTGCEYPVKFGDTNNNVTFSELSMGYYNGYKLYADQKGPKFEPIEGLGQEAFILNDAQVCVLVNDGEAFTVTAMLLAFGEELPISPEELKAGLIEIATKVAKEL